MTARAFCLALLVAMLSACGGDAPNAADAADPAARTTAAGAAASSATSAEAPRAEPTEEEMRALEQAAIDATNANGGIVIEMSGARSRPIMMKLESFRKTGCKPYTKAFRCEAEIGLSYPNTELPAETLPSSHRYRQDAQGVWTRD